MLRYLPILALALLFSSCNSNKSCSNSCFYDDGSKKPIVVLAPMLDSTSYDVPWSLSEEFSLAIKADLKKKGSFYFMPEMDTHNLRENPFGSSLSWVKKNYKPSEFVVFIELVEHEDVSVAKETADPSSISASRKNAANLNMSVRLRIIDIRKDEPMIVLQEMIKNSYYMANTIDVVDYTVHTWGSENYQNTPMEIAHRELIDMIQERISEYVQLAKTR